MANISRILKSMAKNKICKLFVGYFFHFNSGLYFLIDITFNIFLFDLFVCLFF